MSKSLEILEKLYDKNQFLFTEKCYEIFDLIKQDLELLEQLKQQRDSLAINNGELCVKVCELEKENQELLVNKNLAQKLAVEYKNKIDKLEKAIEILKKLKIVIYKGWGTWCIKIDDWSEIEEEQSTLLKEVLE